LRNVTHYCYSKKASSTQPFGLEQNLLTVCIKGRVLQLYLVDETTNSLTLFKEINLPELCIQIVSELNSQLKKRPLLNFILTNSKVTRAIYAWHVRVAIWLWT
jgi:hypothetical protein